MIESLLLKNCQRVKRLFVKFGPVTCLTGNSDAGKSTCWRALRIICLNPKIPSRPKGVLPKGPKFARHGTSTFQITLKVDGHTITRIKGKRNIYILDGKVYKNPDKTGIPKPIQNILKTSGLNFQSQHSLPFWFHDSPSQVSKDLNKVINLEQIDQIMDNSAALSRKAKASYTETKQRLQEAKQELEGLNHVPQLVAQVQELVQLDARIQKTSARIKRGANFGQEISRAKSAIRKHPPPRLGHDIRRMGELAEKIRAKVQRIGRLNDLLEAIKERKESVRCLTQQRNDTTRELKRILTKVKSCPLCRQPTITQS